MRRLNNTPRVWTPQVINSPSSDWLRFNMASEPKKDIDVNQYSTHKSISHGIINVALFISNGKGLRGAIDDLHGDSKCKGDTDCIARSYSYAVAAIFILSLSLLLQVKLGTKFIFPQFLMIVSCLQAIAGYIAIFLGQKDINKLQGEEMKCCDKTNRALLALSFTITLLNALVSGVLQD